MKKLFTPLALALGLFVGTPATQGFGQKTDKVSEDKPSPNKTTPHKMGPSKMGANEMGSGSMNPDNMGKKKQHKSTKTTNEKKQATSNRR